MMTVTFDGVEYTKASQVAKEFGYTSDYIGQLCRAKKINARLVGRSWFVNVPSLEAHREGRYTATKQTAVKPTVTETAGQKSQPVAIRTNDDIPNKKYLRRVPAPERKLKKVIERTDNASGDTKQVSVRYEADEHSLLPKMTTTPRTTLKVDIAESERVRVTSESRKSSKLVPEPLPDVALSGKLSVSEIPDGEYTNDPDDPKLQADTAESNSSKRDNVKNKVKIKKIETPDEDMVQAESVQKEVDSDSDPENQTAELSKKPAVTVKVAKNSVKPKKTLKNAPAATSATTETVEATGKSITVKEIPVRDVNASATPSPIQIHIPAAGVVLGVLVGSMILSAQQVGIVTDQLSDFDIEFAWSNIRNLAAVLFTGH